MPCPRWHDHGIAIPGDVRLFPVSQDELEFPLLYPEELVDVLVQLVADLLARFQAHHNQLLVLSGVHDPPEVFVFQGLFLDWSEITYRVSRSTPFTIVEPSPNKEI